MDATKVLAEGGIVISPELKDALVKNIERRMTPTPIRVRADIELSCFTYEGAVLSYECVGWRSALIAGIDAVREALMAGEACSNDDMQIKVALLVHVLVESRQIKLVAPPLYVMMTTSLEKDAGVRLICYCMLA